MLSGNSQEFTNITAQIRLLFEIWRVFMIVSPNISVSLGLGVIGISKSVIGIGWFYFVFFRRRFGKFSFFSKTTLPVFKKVLHRVAHYPMCLHKSLVSFYLTPLPTAFEKVWGEFSIQIFGFSSFSKTARPNLSFWVQRIEKVVGISPA